MISSSYKIFRDSRREVFCKNRVLRNFEKFTGKHLCQTLFFNKVGFIKKMTLAQVFFCEFWRTSSQEISKNTFSYRTPPVVVSESSLVISLFRHIWSGGSQILITILCITELYKFHYLFFQTCAFDHSKRSFDLKLREKRFFILLPQKVFKNIVLLLVTVWKVSKYGVFSGPYFPVFGLNTERYFVFPRIQSQWGKIRTRKNSVFGHFSHRGILAVLR